MSSGQWTFLSNHAHVLVCIARNPDSRVREIAEQVGITERAVMRIISELEEAGFVSHERHGRRNRYSIDPDRQLRHPLEEGVLIRQLLQPILELSSGEPADEDDSDDLAAR